MKFDLFSRRELPSLALFVAALAVLFVVYRDTIMRAYDVMMISDTYSHIMFAPIVSIFLAWRSRRLAPASPSTLMDASAWCGLLLIALIGVAWLIGQSAGVNAAAQFMLVTMIGALVLAIWGWSRFWFFVFPLGFLFLAVPFGDAFEDTMMIWTADATVWLLRLSGLAVFRDGLHFQLPSGRWSVVEACSGLRYLLAILPLAGLYAYLTYRKLSHRVAFVGLAILISVIGNWIRAYLIVMIGHYSGMTLAVGVDHLIYGWVFFGVLVALLFWIGGRWADAPESQAGAMNLSTAAADRAPTTGSRFWTVMVPRAIIALMVACVWPFVLTALQGQVHPGISMDGFKSALQAQGAPPTIDFQPKYSDYSQLARGSLKARPKLDYFVAQYAQQHTHGEMISWKNRLVTTEGTAWFPVGSRLVMVGGENKNAPLPFEVLETELRGFDGRTLRVWTWYRLGSWTLTAPWKVKLLTPFRLLGQGRDESYFSAIYGFVEPGRKREMDQDFSELASQIQTGLNLIAK
jgi:exosortase A